jgi:hypothetical protein
VQIEKGIPLPPKRGRIGEMRKLLAAMEIGDSVLTGNWDEANCAYKLAKAPGPEDRHPQGRRWLADMEDCLKSSIEESLAFQMRAAKLPPPTREHRFHGERKWRFDFAWVDEKIAAECEGAIYMNGRHTRGSGFEKDCEKYNAAMLMGWRVFKFTSRMVKEGEALKCLTEVLT